MKLRGCVREQEVAEILRAGHWPEACDPALRNHVNSCERCEELVLLWQAFQGSRAEAMASANLAHPGTLWWRAQLRRRNEALERVSRPTRWVGGFAFLSALAVMLGFVIWQRQYAEGWLEWLGGLSHSGSFRMASLWSPAGNWNLVLTVAVFVSVVLFGAIAAYLVSEKS
jgi:hypothetical protein